MPVYALAQLTMEQLLSLADLEDRGVVHELWEERSRGELTSREDAFLAVLLDHIVSYKVQLANEATVWGRAIFPLILLAERGKIQAFAGVPLSASFAHGELRGEVDGALSGARADGQAMAPYLLVVEAKRGVEGHVPVAQLLGGLLCAATKNHQQRARHEHTLYGAYTISDVWTFVRFSVTALDGERPQITIALSREYMETTEATAILLVLKSIVAELS